MAQDFAQQHTHHRHNSDSPRISLPKKLIVCCDGTWMNSDSGWVKGKMGEKGHLANPTNVTRIARAIKPEDDVKHPQVVYYQAGVGTGIGVYSHLIGGGTGAGLSEHIREAYAFLANNYRAADEQLRPGVGDDSIFLIGFSRGAFTARSIGGLIGAVGVLEKKAMPHFYQIFLDWENAGNAKHTPLFFEEYYDLHEEEKHEKPDVPAPSIELARDFDRIDEYMECYRRRLEALGLTRIAKIKCIGVWDTVGSLGIPVNPILQRILPFLPSYVRDYSWFDTGLSPTVDHAFQALALDEHRYPFSPTLWEKRNDRPVYNTTLKQVWFPGAHSNVGGSYDDGGIANVTLAWMMDQLSGITTVKNPDDRDPKDWIKFDEKHIERWLNHDLKHEDNVKISEGKDAYVGWGMGYLYESNYFPQTVLGARVRGPGRYTRIDYKTGKPTSTLMDNTNEYIHSSVRARLDLGGHAVEDDSKHVFPNGPSIGPLFVRFWRWLTGTLTRPYQPHLKNGPLEHWELDDGHKAHFDPNMDIDMSPQGQSAIKWTYKGKEKCNDPVLYEDRLGPIEMRLLEKDQQFANQIIISNNNWHFQKRPQQPSPRAAQTF